LISICLLGKGAVLRNAAELSQELEAVKEKMTALENQNQM